MHKMRNKSKLSMHIICAVCACLLSCIVVLFTKYSIADPVLSVCYEDLEMPEGKTSILDMASMDAVNSRLEGLRVYDEGSGDAQLILTLKGKKAVEMHSIELALKESYPFEIYCVLYYPNESGEYVEENRYAFTLPKGEKSIYFEIPDDVDYKINQLRVDIDEDYVIDDIFVSEKSLVKEYSFLEHYQSRSAVIYFFVLFLIFEIFLYFWPELLRFVNDIWKKKEKIAALLLILIGSAVGGNIAAYLMFRLGGKDYSWFWAVVVGLCSMVIAYQVLLLRRKEPGLMPAEGNKEANGTLVLFWGGILVFCLLIVFEWIDGTKYVPELRGIIRILFPFVFAIVESILFGLLYQKYILNEPENSISFFNVYIFVFFLLGLAYMLVFLPYVSPDEPSHYMSAYRVSNVLLGKIGQLGDNRLLMRMEDYKFYKQTEISLSAEYYLQTAENFRLFAGEPGYMIMETPMVTNAIFSYFTTGIGIAAARIFHLSGFMAFYAGRFMNLLFFVLVLRHLMKKIPFGRTALFAIAMMPMTLHMVGSYSYDVTTFCIVALFVTQVMCMICSPEKISRRDYLLCVVYGMLMAPSKLVYIPLLFLVLLVPGGQLGDSKKEAWKKKLLVVGSGIASALVIMLVINLISADSAIKVALKDNNQVNLLSWIREPAYTISWVLTHPGEYFLMCVRTIVERMDYYFFTMIGSKLGWLNIDIPQIYAVVSFVLFLLAINIRDDVSAHIRISRGKKIWILILGAASVLCMIVVMTVGYTPVSYDYVTGVQGRYITPLLIPVIWLLRNRMIEVNSAIRKHIVFISTMLNIWVLVYVFAQNVVGV